MQCFTELEKTFGQLEEQQRGEPAGGFALWVRCGTREGGIKGERGIGVGQRSINMGLQPWQWAWMGES